MDSIHDSLRYVHGGGPIPSTVTGHKSGSVKTVPVMCHTSYCHGFWAIDLVYWFFCLIRHSSLRALKGVTSPIHSLDIKPLNLQKYLTLTLRLLPWLKTVLNVWSLYVVQIHKPNFTVTRYRIIELHHVHASVCFLKSFRIDPSSSNNTLETLKLVDFYCFRRCSWPAKRHHPSPSQNPQFPRDLQYIVDPGRSNSSARSFTGLGQSAILFLESPNAVNTLPAGGGVI